MTDEIISLSKFLSRYVNVCGVNLKKITHEEVKALFPFLRRSTFEAVKKHKELLLTGKVVLVTDGKKTIPYYTPVLDYEKESEALYLEREEAPDIVLDDTHYDYSKLSEYKLRALLVRKYNSFRNQCNARHELEHRGIARTKKYKRSDYKKVGED
jgi:hypothetical protein